MKKKKLLETEILLDAVKKTKETEYEKLIKDMNRDLMNIFLQH